MWNLFRRFIVLGLAMVALAPVLAGGAGPAGAATVIYVDDLAGNNNGVNCPNPAGDTIQEGVDAAPDNNATIYVCPGSYATGASLSDMSNIKVIALGTVRIDLDPNYSGFVFMLDGTSNTLITGFQIDGNGTLNPAIPTVAIAYMNGSSGSILKNVISGWRHSDTGTTGALYTGILVENAGVVKIDHNSLYDFEDYGIWVNSSSAPVISRNLLTFNSMAASIPVGIRLEDVPAGAVTSNQLRSNTNFAGTPSQSVGIALTNAGGVKVKSNGIIAILIGLLVSKNCDDAQQSNGNQLTGNKLTDVTTGIQISADNTGSCGASASNNQVLSNTLYFYGLGDAAGAVGIRLEASGTGPVVNGNVLNKNTIAGYGTHVELSTGVTGTDQTPANKTMPVPPPGF